MSTIFVSTGKGGPNWDSTSGTITDWIIPGGTHTIVPTSDTGEVAVFNDGGIHTVGGVGGANADQIALKNGHPHRRSLPGGGLPAGGQCRFPGRPDRRRGLQADHRIWRRDAEFWHGQRDRNRCRPLGCIRHFTAEDLIIGDSKDDIGAVTVNGALEFDIVPDNTVLGNGQLTIGYAGTGSLEITNTAAVFTESAILGLNQGAIGSLSLNSSIWGGGGVTLGAAGTGHMTIGAGASVALTGVVVGSAQTASGDLVVNGASFGVDFLTIGMDGTGTATFETDSIGTFATVTVGDNADAVANLTLGGQA